MVEPLISAALIVRDEARHLESCLGSVREFVDEIVVVDTGSCDDTPKIARAAGAVVHYVPWNNDFAAARNAALDRCRGAWILYVDADERLVPGSEKGIRERLRGPKAVGFLVWLRAHAGVTPYREMRLFRNHPTIRFEGVIHESIWPALGRFMAIEGGRVREVDLMLDHVGYDGDQAHKHPRNLPLLLKRLEQDPEHAYSHWHLGATYKGLGDIDRARDSWQAAVASARRRRGRDWSHALSFIGLIELDAERPEVVGPLIDEAMQRFPDHPNLVWLKARALMRESRWREAVVILEDLVAWRRRPRQSDGIVGADKRLFGLFAHDGLATCHFRLEQYEVAAYYYDLAVASAPDPMEYRVKRQLCLKLAGRAAPSNGARPMFSEARAESRDSAAPSSDAPCPAP